MARLLLPDGRSGRLSPGIGDAASYVLQPGSGMWLGRSYQRRFELTGERLLDQKLYDAVCYVTSSPESPLPVEPSARLDWSHFSAAINARIRYLKDLGFP
jgi:hypothetical protein